MGEEPFCTEKPLEPSVPKLDADSEVCRPGCATSSASVADAPCGYLHPTYADALSEYGRPVLLPQSGAWVLERAIPGFSGRDAMGCYPLFLCQDWSSLLPDLERLEQHWVALALVTDPFANSSPEYLRQCFPDVMVPFKHHYIVDLSGPYRNTISAHHSRNARKAMQVVTVEVSQEPASLLDEWVALYDVLIDRHGIRGLRAFSRKSFARQLLVPGLVALRASVKGTVVGMLLWYVIDDIAYYHLGASDGVGYDLGASFALFRYALDYFADRGVRWLDLGGGTGTFEASDDGLSRFKKGWANDEMVTYFCGRIFDHTRYREIVDRQGTRSKTTYFPLYRDGEFN